MTHRPAAAHERRDARVLQERAQLKARLQTQEPRDDVVKTRERVAAQDHLHTLTLDERARDLLEKPSHRKKPISRPTHLDEVDARERQRHLLQLGRSSRIERICVFEMQVRHLYKAC